jgi:hypothetical protein
MNTLTLDVVKDKITEMYKSVSRLTTLEVKEALRKDGYWAEQKLVSSHMWELVYQGYLTKGKAADWRDYSFQPFHYFYLNLTPQQSSSNPVKCRTMADVEETTIPSKGDWEVFTHYSKPDICQGNCWAQCCQGVL